MNRVLIVMFSFLIMFPLSLYTQTDESTYIQPSFLPFCVDVMGMGGAFTASSQGYSSLFYNPAGFTKGDYSLTFISAGPWSYTDPFTFFSLPGMNENEKLENLTNEILSGGYGSGIHAGIGFVKKGLGIGASFIMDSYLSSEGDISEATGGFHMTLGFILGYAHTFTISDMLLSIGADLRPMARVYVPVTGANAADILNSYANGENGDLFKILADDNTLHGLAIGFDAGVIGQIGNFKFGLSVRDIGGTQFDYRESTFDEVMDSLANSGIFPKDADTPDGIYKIPMNISAGISYHFDLGDLSKIIDPQIHLDLQDIVNNLLEKKSFLLLLHLGAEASFYDIVTIRAGFAEGYFSVGMGINVLFLDLNLAFFNQENGDSPWEIPNSCSLIELAVRMKL